MATQSAAQPQTPGADTVQPENETQQDAKAEATKQDSTTSVFVNSEPIREDQVQNAVKFLSHPKVMGSPVIYRRSFLEKKGLTKEEIDEAFRRVPDVAPSAQTVTSQGGQVKSSPTVQPHPSAQTIQPQAASPIGVIPPGGGTLSRYQFHWSHAFLAVGFLAVTSAGTAVLVKKALVPRLKSWVRKVVSEEENDPTKQTTSKPSLAEEAAAAAKAAAAAAADVAKASQEMLNSKSEEKKYFDTFANLLDVQVKEIKSLSNSIRKLEAIETNTSGRSHSIKQEDYRVSTTNIRQPNVKDRGDYDSRSVRSSSPPGQVESTVAPHPKSYMEIMSMVQRGERPSNIREINDLPPNPNQQPSNPRLVPRNKPWEVVNPVQNNYNQVLQSQGSGEGMNGKAHDNGSYQSYVDSPAPWRQQKNGGVELGTEDEVRSGSFGAPNPEQLVQQRTWVPPLPPPVAMPGAAEAIRRPKPAVQPEQYVVDKSVDHPSDVSDELQRVTKISESGGELETNGESSGLHTSEIQEVEL